MCERHSIESAQLAHSAVNHHEKINLLQSQVNRYQKEILQKNKQIQQLTQIRKNIKKIPYNIYKEFLITTQSDGSVVNLMKKKSLQIDGLLPLNDSSHLNTDKENYERYLLIKIKGQKPALFFSATTEISTLEKLNLNKYASEQRQSYQFISPELHNTSTTKNHLKLCEKVVNLKIIESQTKVKKVEINQEHKKLLQFPPSKIPDLRRKESLPLKTQCEILSDDLRKLKQKISTYTKVLEEKSVPTSVSSLRQLNELKEPKSVTDQAFIQEKLKEISPLDFDSIRQKKWEQEKQKYIEYIQGLQKQLKTFRSQQSSMVNQGSFNGFTPAKSQVISAIKSTQNYESTPYDKIRSNQTIGLAPQKYSIFKGDPQQTQRSYFKNQYHVNSQQKSRSKSKGSKVIFLRR